MTYVRACRVSLVAVVLGLRLVAFVLGLRWVAFVRDQVGGALSYAAVHAKRQSERRTKMGHSRPNQAPGRTNTE
jgi:hypothetical protein